MPINKRIKVALNRTTLANLAKIRISLSNHKLVLKDFLFLRFLNKMVIFAGFWAQNAQIRVKQTIVDAVCLFHYTNRMKIDC